MTHTSHTLSCCTMHMLPITISFWHHMDTLSVPHGAAMIRNLVLCLAYSFLPLARIKKPTGMAIIHCII